VLPFLENVFVGNDATTAGLVMAPSAPTVYRTPTPDAKGGALGGGEPGELRGVSR
jgi:hypothetical protein